MNQEDKGSVNSNPYWEHRFATDWDTNAGREQTGFFTRVAIDNLPSWLVRDIRRESLTICDWGCAEGDGVDIIASYLDAPVTGVDFSQAAIEKARSFYPGRSFVCADFLTSEADERFDVIFSSNTLEHFADPWSVLSKVAERASKFLVLMLPFQEYERISEHFVTFDYKNVPFVFHGFGLVHARVIDTSSMRPNYWPGKQILLVYGTEAALSSLRLQLEDVRIDDPARFDIETARNQLEASLHEIVGKLKMQIDRETAARQAADEARRREEVSRQREEASRQGELAAVRALEAAQALQIETRGELVKRDARINSLERSLAELDLIKASRSWRWTKPIRFFLRTVRQRGVRGEDLAALRRLLGRKRSGSRAMARMLVDSEVVSPPMPALAPCMPGKRDFFVWAVIDWHFRIQRPQHLSRELANAGHRVFYISNEFVDRDEPGFAVEPLNADGRLFRIQLHLKGRPAIYHAIPTPDAQQQLRAGIGMVLAWTRSRACASLVQHPYWLETAHVLPNHRLTYDCMDHHGGFADNSPEVLAREADLMRTSDLLVVTSDWLYEEACKYNTRRLMVRNACQYEHFATRPERVFQDEQGRRVIGYYGAIAEWFDLDLLEQVARRHADCLVLLVGADTAGARHRLQHLGNVQFTGEVPYGDLPFYLHGFDVCLLPFQVLPLTLATNPVKVYEYLSAGKTVVSIALPEIRQFGELVLSGTDHASFLLALEEALRATPTPDIVQQRQRFAAEQTWAHRVHDLVQGIDAVPEPQVSVVVVTYNNLDLTKACLQSLERYSDYSNLEVIVVDNASSDGTRDYLTEWAAAGEDRQLILNAENRGFAAANNQGLAVASGEYLVLLNNDTHVTPGWIATSIAHLRRSKTLGMVGPVTNNIGNEAKIDIAYDGMEDMLAVAGDYTARHAGQLTPLRTAAFFCVMFRREVYERVGPLDEAFGIGFFEDDDYCRRVEQAGWSIACAEDVFVHHHLSASFNKLKHEKRQALFERNKLAYEAKWGTWVPHKYRVR